MKKLRLDTEYDYGFELYGVATATKEYKLAWLLNKLLKFRLVKQTDLCYQLQGHVRFLISNYQYHTEHSVVRLFRNKALDSNPARGTFLLPDIKEFDYIVQVAGALKDFCSQELVDKLHLNPVVQHVKKIDPLTLYNKDNLIF
ncbi:IPExxxVDY family protein [Botryobacter ruber]|uniref:IPExxxVDY family protein n=1 Tax=Botryobacter ruber TaxID=2171629 RepID=UPI000E0A22E4|nr:IPExxxVDY family protein [Botryobacter ruber]